MILLNLNLEKKSLLEMKSMKEKTNSDNFVKKKSFLLDFCSPSGEHE